MVLCVLTREYVSVQKVEEEVVDTSSDEVPEGFVPIRLRQGETIRPAWFKATQRVDDFVGKVRDAVFVSACRCVIHR